MDKKELAELESAVRCVLFNPNAQRATYQNKKPTASESRDIKWKLVRKKR